MTQREWLAELFKAPGFFVEAGAHDGVGDSTTKWLEDAGWHGICVEPSRAFEGLKASRRCTIDNRPLWREDGASMEWAEVDSVAAAGHAAGSGAAVELSGLVATFADGWDRSRCAVSTRTTVSLPTLLAEHGAPGVVEFLSLDTEGSEYEILAGHDFAQFSIVAMSVEINGVESKRAAIRGLLIPLGYTVDARTDRWQDEWYVHRDLARAALGRAA